MLSDTLIICYQLIYSEDFAPELLLFVPTPHGA